MDFKLPDIGEGVHEGEITKWLVKAGDPIKTDQPMVEVMTDKATVEIPSPVTGTVSGIFAKEGETIEVGKVIVTIQEGGAPAAKAAPAPAPAPTKAATPPPQDVAPKASAPQTRSVAPAAPAAHDEVLPFGILATPATRKLSRELEVDLKSLKGTGVHGRITKDDVLLAYEGTQAAEPRTSHTSSSVAMRQAEPLATRATSTKVASVSRGELQRIPLKGIRKKIAQAMTHSKHTAAHFTYVEEVDMTEVVKMRAAAQDEAKKRGIKLSFLPFIIKGLIPALKEFPLLNASLDDDSQEIIVKGDYNIGVATDTDNGLMVPVIKNAESKNIWELASEISELSDRARHGKSALEDLKGGTFTVTNAGSIGGVFTAPIINHPEVAILGVNAIRKRPMVVNDQIVIRDMMYFSMSVDHRVVDGADAARFMNRLVYFLNDPQRLVFA